jgi:PPOX class probable F420-dependent enzyme
MSTIPQGARDFLAAGPLAHVVTLNPDGTPHVSLAWAGVDGDGIVWSSFSDQHKLANLRRDPRITLSFEAHESGGEMLHPYLVIRGRATIFPGGALDVMDQLAEFYLGPGLRFPMRDAPPGLTIRVDGDKAYGIGSWRNAGDGSEGPDET